MKGFASFKGGMAALGFAAVTLALSCAASISRGGEYGTLTVAFGGPRGLETGWPGGTLPSFGTVTVKVSASDMATVTATASSNSGSISVQVPAGSDRLVEVTAEPAAGGTAPFFAKSYYGSASADLAEGQKTTVSIALSLSESKIVLPNYTNTPNTLGFANSLSGGVVQTEEINLSEYSDFELDSYGRAFVSGVGLTRYTSLSNADFFTESSILATAYDTSRNILYSLEESEGIYLVYRDLSGASYTTLNVDGSSEAEFSDNYGLSLAAGDGYVYVPTYFPNEDTYGIGKYTVTAVSENAQANFVTFASFSDLGISGDLELKDMIVKDGVLYLLAAESSAIPYTYNDDLVSRGKMIAVSTTNLTKLWETGYSGTNLPNNPDKQFYGPVRFVGVAPKKLYIADEGFLWVSTTAYWGNPVNVDRVVEVDLAKGAITDSGLEDDAAFFSDFSTVTIYSTDYQS